MTNKYIINPGLAFSEESLITKLNNYAKKGWILDKFTHAGFFLKLVKGEPTDHIYCMDARKNVDNDYYRIFETSGWKHVTSDYGMYHFFQAPKGTTPFYTDPITIKEKHTDIQELTRKGALYSGLILTLTIILQIVTASTLPIIAWISFIIGFISLIVFVFCFMPWVAYKWKNRQL